MNIHIFDYLDFQLSKLFTQVPLSPDNRGWTVIGFACRWGWLAHCTLDPALCAFRKYP